jgi:hypothetical protein
MQIIRECRMRAAILTGLAKDAPELEIQLLYVAKVWLTLAILREQFNADADAAAQMPEVMNWHSVQESGTKRLNVFHCESYVRCRSCVRSTNALVLERLRRRRPLSFFCVRSATRTASQ